MVDFTKWPFHDFARGPGTSAPLKSSEELLKPGCFLLPFSLMPWASSQIAAIFHREHNVIKCPVFRLDMINVSFDINWANHIGTKSKFQRISNRWRSDRLLLCKPSSDKNFMSNRWREWHKVLLTYEFCCGKKLSSYHQMAVAQNATMIIVSPVDIECKKQ